jgi:hypothetical protein
MAARSRIGIPTETAAERSPGYRGPARSSTPTPLGALLATGAEHFCMRENLASSALT